MSTILNTNGTSLEVPRIKDENAKIAVITAEWNSDITYALRDGAVETLKEGGLSEENILCFKVPGTVELVSAAFMARQYLNPKAIIVIGCVIRGDTPHFDYVCQHTATGIATLNAGGDVPVIFGVLTVDNLTQAEERAGGKLGNKGSEAACAAIEMANMKEEIYEILAKDDFLEL